jgi:hypothetical protein
MKRYLFVIFVLVMMISSLSAQAVKTIMGDFTLNGTMVTGVVTEMTQQQENANDGKWNKLSVRNPDWTENRFELGLTYVFGDYGAYVSLKTPGPVNDFWDPDPIDVGNAFVYANFLDEKIKVSIGKLYGQLFFWPGTEVWKTKLIGNNFRFTDEDETSFRMEFKFIENLNFGFQYFFVNQEDGDERGLLETDAWKEFGIGAQYEIPDKFGVQAGIRFDSNADGMKWLESATIQGYIDEYYGLNIGGGTYSSAALGIYPLLGSLTSPYKHLDDLYDYSGVDWEAEDVLANEIPVLPFDGGAYTYFGFQISAVKDLPIAGRAGFFNIGAFDKFGFVYMLETVSYTGVKDFQFSFSMSQQFYGNDVFKDGVVNSPMFTFDPEVQYKLPIRNFSATLTGSFGLCPDVLNYQFSVKPKLSYALGLGLGSVELYYLYEHKDFVTGLRSSDDTRIHDKDYHKIGLGVWWMF